MSSEPTSLRSPARDTDLEMRELWNIARRQSRVIIACAALAIALAYLVVASRPPVYSASALIRVEESRSGPPRLEQRDLIETGNRVATEMEVLQSRTLAAAVVDTLGLQLRVADVPGGVRAVAARVEIPSDAPSATYRLLRQKDGSFALFDGDADEPRGEYRPGVPMALNGATIVLATNAAQYPELTLEVRSNERAAQDLLGRLAVTRTNRDADLIRIEYLDADPTLARDVVNALVQRFLSMRVDAQRAEVRNTIAFLHQQLDTVGIQLAAAEDELRAYRERAQVIDPGAEAGEQVSRLAALQAERSSLEAERTALARLVDGLGTHESATGTASPYRRLVAFPTLMRNPAASDILSSLIAVENERAALLTRRKMSDPDVVVSSERIAQLEAQLREFVRTYLAGLASQVQSMDAVIAQSRQQLDRVPASEVQFARLSRQPELLAGIYATLKTRLTEAEIAQASTDPTIQVVDAATMPTRPLQSSRTLPLGAAGIIGLLLGVVVAFVREHRDQCVHSRADVNAVLGVPVIGLIPRTPAAGDRRFGRLAPLPPRGDGVLPPPACADKFAMPGSEAITLATQAYDGLYTYLQFARPAGNARAVVFTSPLPGDGKTTVAATFAVTLALRGLRVLLIDGDLRRGRVADLFGVPATPGLAEVLTDPSTLREAVQAVAVGTDATLYCMTTGAPTVIPSQLLGSDTMRSLVQTLEQSFDRIIIDSPPLNLVPDAAVLGACGLDVVVVTRAGVTSLEALTYAAEQFRHAGTSVIGAVVNDIDFGRDSTYDPAYRSYRYAKSYYTPTARA